MKNPSTTTEFDSADICLLMRELGMTLNEAVSLSERERRLLVKLIVQKRLEGQ